MFSSERRQGGDLHSANEPCSLLSGESASDYLGVDPNRRSLNGTGGYVKAGRKGNAKWAFSETFNDRLGFDSE